MARKPVRESYQGHPDTHVKRIDYTKTGTAVEVGRLKNGDNIMKSLSGIRVVTAFNGGGTDLLDVGYAAYTDSSGSSVVADPNAFGTAMDLSSTGYTELDEAAANFYADCDEDGIGITATYTDASADASAGVVAVMVTAIATL